MPSEELEGVIAHELAHIRNRDMLISTVAAGIAGAIGYLPYLLMFGGGSPDDEARHPGVELAMMLLAPLAQVNPLAAHGGGIMSLFRTHPPAEERVARLEKLARGMSR